MKDILAQDIRAAIQALQANGTWPQFEIPVIPVDVPNIAEHGDVASSIAMQLVKILKKNPVQIAQDIQSQLSGQYTKIEVVPPGFINVFLGTDAFAAVAEDILKQGDTYGDSKLGAGKNILVEFISANPTGPLTLPNGRGGYLGDVLSNVLQHTGHTVTREYYVNDRGNQVDILARSIVTRYLQRKGVQIEFAPEFYQGDYIDDLAQELAAPLDQANIERAEQLEEGKEVIKGQALGLMLDAIKHVVKQKMRITYDNWFSERSLYDNGIPEQMLTQLNSADAVYEENGAIWLKTSAYGDDKDRVLIKQTGEGAYLQGDVALFFDRSHNRNISKVILVLGADHHGYEKRLKAIPQLLHSQTEFDLIFTQMATLMKDGVEVRMSKRKGNFVEIEELIDEVGNDVARFFFLMYSADRHMNFDLDLAKEQSDKNPVYYVQYAHARLCSIMREVKKIGEPNANTHMNIEHDAEKALLKQLVTLPELLESIAQSYEVHHLTTYAQDVARTFHHFYGQCRVIENDVVNPTRYALVQATQIVLHKTLLLIGVSAPEKM